MDHDVLNLVGEAVFGFGLRAITAYPRQFLLLLQTNIAAVLTIDGVNELINLGRGLDVCYALLLAPLSLVQAIDSTSTLFVFYPASRCRCSSPPWRENLSSGNLVQK